MATLPAGFGNGEVPPSVPRATPPSQAPTQPTANQNTNVNFNQQFQPIQVFNPLQQGLEQQCDPKVNNCCTNSSGQTYPCSQSTCDDYNSPSNRGTPSNPGFSCIQKGTKKASFTLPSYVNGVQMLNTPCPVGSVRSTIPPYDCVSGETTFPVGYTMPSTAGPCPSGTSRSAPMMPCMPNNPMNPILKGAIIVAAVAAVVWVTVWVWNS